MGQITLYVSVFIILSAVTQSAHAFGRVFNGTREERAYPWVVWIRRGPEIVCGGTLVHRRWVMTSAYCVIQGYRWDYTVIAGDYNRNKKDGKQVMKVRDIVIHPLFWSRTREYDMAMVKLSKSVKTRRTSAAVIGRLSTTQLDARMKAVKSRCVSVGWGEDTDKSGDLESTTFRQEAVTKILPDDRCKRAPHFGQMANVCYRSAYKNKALCQRDTGGPIACMYKGTWTLAGVQGYSVDGIGRENTQTCEYGFMVGGKVSAQKTWIDGTINNKDTMLPTYSSALKNRAMFLMLDLNNDGVLDRDAGRAFLKSYLEASSNTVMSSVYLACWESLFTKKQMTLSMVDYVMIPVRSHQSGMSKQEIKNGMHMCMMAVFTTADDNVDDYTSGEEYRKVMMSFGHTNTTAIDAAFNWYQPTHDRVPVAKMASQFTDFLTNEKQKKKHEELLNLVMAMVTTVAPEEERGPDENLDISKLLSSLLDSRDNLPNVQDLDPSDILPQELPNILPEGLNPLDVKPPGLNPLDILPPGLNPLDVIPHVIPSALNLLDLVPNNLDDVGDVLPINPLDAVLGGQGPGDKIPNDPNPDDPFF